TTTRRAFISVGRGFGYLVRSSCARRHRASSSSNAVESGPPRQCEAFFRLLRDEGGAAGRLGQLVSERVRANFHRGTVARIPVAPALNLRLNLPCSDAGVIGPLVY